MGLSTPPRAFRRRGLPGRAKTRGDTTGRAGDPGGRRARHDNCGSFLPTGGYPGRCPRRGRLQRRHSIRPGGSRSAPPSRGESVSKAGAPIRNPGGAFRQTHFRYALRHSLLAIFRVLKCGRLPLPHGDPNHEPHRERYCKQRDKEKLLPDRS